MLEALKLQSRMENHIEGSSLQNTGPLNATTAALVRGVELLESSLDMVVKGIYTWWVTLTPQGRKRESMNS